MAVGWYVQLFRRSWVAILVLAVLGTACGAVFAYTQNAKYAAKTQLFVVSASRGSDLSDAYQGDLLSQQRAKSYTTLITSLFVARKLVDELNLPYSPETLQGEISATNPSNTSVIETTVTDDSVTRAKRIADAIGPVFASVASGVDRPGGGGGSEVRVVGLRPAQALSAPVSPHKTLDIALGLIAGLFLGAVWSVIREVTNSRIRDADDAVRSSGIAVLGAVSDGTTGSGGELLPETRRSREAVEAYRRLAVNVVSAGSGSLPQSIVVAPPTGGDGAPQTAVGLAIALAENGATVTLVDTAPGGGRLAAFLGLSPGLGLRDVLAGRASAEQALRPWRTDVPLKVITGGSAEGSTGDAPLREPSLAALREELARTSDVVIFAASAILTETDTVVLARLAGQAVIVVKAGVTRDFELEQAVQCLRQVGATVLGLALDGAPGDRGRRHMAQPSPRHAPA